MKLSHKTISGFSLVDIVLAAAILAVALAGVYGLFFFGINTLRTADNRAIANKNLAQRLAQIQRTSNWINVTSPSYIGALLSTPIPTTTQNLPGVTKEIITISTVSVPYASPVPASTPSPTATSSFAVTRTVGSSGGGVTSSGASLSSAAAVEVKASIQWNDQSGRPHTRELSTRLSNAGITR